MAPVEVRLEADEARRSLVSNASEFCNRVGLAGEIGAESSNVGSPIAVDLVPVADRSRAPECGQVGVVDARGVKCFRESGSREPRLPGKRELPDIEHSAHTDILQVYDKRVD
jgi:hypothetical protein